MKWRFILIMLLFSAVQALAADSLLKQGDRAEAEFDNTQALEFYQQAWNHDPTGWDTNLRLVRSSINVGEDAPDDQKEALFRQAMVHTDDFMTLFPDSAAPYLYTAMAYGRMAMFLGGKEKVKLSREIETSLKKCLAIEPDNARAHAILGVYYRNIADLSWVLKTFANAFLGGLPEGTMEMAKQELETALRLQPDDIYHQLEYGKTMLMMEQKQKARQALQRVMQLPVLDHRDPFYQQEAQKLLNDL